MERLLLHLPDNLLQHLSWRKLRILTAGQILPMMGNPKWHDGIGLQPAFLPRDRRVEKLLDMMSAILLHSLMNGLHVIEFTEARTLLRCDITLRILSDEPDRIPVKVCQLRLIRIQIQIGRSSVFLKQINAEEGAEHILLRQLDPLSLYLAFVGKDPDNDQKCSVILFPETPTFCEDSLYP